MLLTVALGASACGTSAASPPVGSSPVSAATDAKATAPPVADLPDPNASIGKDPARIARSLRETTNRLRAAIDAWVKEGAGTPPPEPVVLLSLHQQRIYRHLARRPQLSSRVIARLPAALAAEAKDNVTAVRGLLSLAHPVSGKPKLKLRDPLPPKTLMRHFKRAERRFGVDWEVLAAVMFVETKFGRVRSASHTGAQGPMQFMPGTWKAYGMGGNVHDTGDAVMGAANYLRASGAPGNYRRALYAYNHSYAYVDAVQAHARRITRDVRNFYAYYNWQVYVITTKGERRLTGPGL